jgi:hypothetical protein
MNALRNNEKEVVYVATEANLPILESQRLQKKDKSCE